MKDQINILSCAARAVGRFYEHDGNGGYLTMGTSNGETMRFAWNPLEDAGDCFRLASRLRLDIHFSSSYIVYEDGGRSNVIHWDGWREDVHNVYEAVVMAAAKIGGYEE